MYFSVQHTVPKSDTTLVTGTTVTTLFDYRTIVRFGERVFKCILRVFTCVTCWKPLASSKNLKVSRALLTHSSEVEDRV